MSSNPTAWVPQLRAAAPGTHTTLRLVLTLDGEKIVDCVPDIGYLHSGFEKMGEVHDLNQYVTVTDRMNYLSPVMNNLVIPGMVRGEVDGIELTSALQGDPNDHLGNPAHPGPRTVRGCVGTGSWRLHAVPVPVRGP